MNKKNIILLKFGLFFIISILTVSCGEDCKFNSILTDTLPDGTVGEKYYYKIELGTSCSAPYKKVELSEGDLPKGLILETSGELVDTPTVAGIYTFKIKARICFGSNGFEYIDCTDKTKELTLKIK